MECVPMEVHTPSGRLTEGNNDANIVHAACERDFTLFSVLFGKVPATFRNRILSHAANVKLPHRMDVFQKIGAADPDVQVLISS